MEAQAVRRSAVLVIMALLLPGLPSLYALETELNWRVGGDSVLFHESIRAAGAGYSASISSSVGESDSVLLDSRRSTLEWRRRVGGEGTELSAIRSGGQLRLEGLYKGRKYEKTLELGDLPWYEFQELSYEYLFSSGARTSRFWTIDRKTLKATRFSAERRESTSIEIMGKPVRAIEFALTVEGIPSFVFSSKFFIRESDGRFLRLEVPAILNLPRSSVELSKETP